MIRIIFAPSYFLHTYIEYRHNSDIHVRPFKDEPQYSNFTAARLSAPSSCTPDLIALAHRCLDEIFRPGFRYKKTGVMLSDILADDHSEGPVRTGRKNNLIGRAHSDSVPGERKTGNDAMQEKEKIPGEQECLALMKEHRMLPNIVEHSLQVMRVALSITDDLKNPGQVDRELILAASLLHDITKTSSLESHERHDVTGGVLLRALGLGRIAFIVEQHVLFTNFDPRGPLEEREIVYYADKCVMHDRIVSVDRRVDDLIERYGTTAERRENILKNKELILDIGRKIAGFMRNDINRVIGN